MIVNLPDEPVDEYVVEWWHAPFIELPPVRCRAVFHIRQLWAAHPWSVNNPGGHDFLSQWALWADGRAEGRLDGWSRLASFVDRDCFATAREALDHLRTEALLEEARLVEQLQAVRARYNELEEALTRCDSFS